MNRKWIAAGLASLMLLAVGCGKKPEEKPRPQPPAPQQPARPAEPLPPEKPEAPEFPNSLAETDAEVSVDDLIAVLGRTEQELKDAMRGVATVGDNVDNACTYRHKLLGRDAEVSYVLDDARNIARVTVRTAKEHMTDWRNRFTEMVDAMTVDGMQDTWTYQNSRIRMTENGDDALIVIEKEAS